jgi:hypothetical protein
MADGRERQVSGHQQLAVRRQLPQKTDPDDPSLESNVRFLRPYDEVV